MVQPVQLEQQAGLAARERRARLVQLVAPDRPAAVGQQARQAAPDRPVQAARRVAQAQLVTKAILAAAGQQARLAAPDRPAAAVQQAQRVAPDRPVRLAQVVH
jgi:hypothetical protein